MDYRRKHHIFDHLADWNLVTLDIEWIWVKLSLNYSRPTYICTLYWPPSGVVDIFLTLLESKLIVIYSMGLAHVVILGDVNIDVKNEKSPLCKKYDSYVQSLGLTQLIRSPTRVTLGQSTIIDHILTNNDHMYHTGNCIDLGISDHHLIFTNRKKAKIPKTFSYIKCRTYRHFCPIQFQEYIDNINWTSLYQSTDVNAAAKIYTALLLAAIDIYAPFIRLKCRDHAPKWLNGDLLSHIDEREFLSDKYSKCPCEYHLVLKNESKMRTATLKRHLQLILSMP